MTTTTNDDRLRVIEVLRGPYGHLLGRVVRHGDSSRHSLLIDGKLTGRVYRLHSDCGSWKWVRR